MRTKKFPSWAAPGIGRRAGGVAVLTLLAISAYMGGAREAWAEPGQSSPDAASQAAAQRHLFQQNPVDGSVAAPNVPQRDGHMSAEDRKLLRQHIEDAGRDIYKR
jgi:uncharacterized membrane protein YebE (DUF533 family)